MAYALIIEKAEIPMQVEATTQQDPAVDRVASMWDGPSENTAPLQFPQTPMAKNRVELPRDIFSTLVSHYCDSLREQIESIGVTLSFDTESALSQSPTVVCIVSGSEEQRSKIHAHLDEMMARMKPLLEGRPPIPPYNPASTLHSPPLVKEEDHSGLEAGSSDNSDGGSEAEGSASPEPSASSSMLSPTSTASAHSPPSLIDPAVQQQQGLADTSDCGVVAQNQVTPSPPKTDTTTTSELQYVQHALLCIKSSPKELRSATLGTDQATSKIPRQSEANPSYSTASTTKKARRELAQKSAEYRSVQRQSGRKWESARKTAGCDTKRCRASKDVDEGEIITIDADD